jgi:hypothetical protein
MPIEIELIPHLERAKLKAEKEAIEKEIKDLKVEINAKVGIEKEEAQNKLNELVAQKDELGKRIDLSINDSGATQTINDLGKSLNNVGARSLALQKITGKLKDMRGETMSVNNILKTTSLSFNALGKLNFKGLVGVI